MREATFRIGDPLLSDVLAFIDNTAALPERLRAELQPDPQADRLRFKFTRNLALYVAISTTRGRARFADDYPEEMEAFDKRLAGFFAHAVGFFALAAQLARQPAESGAETLRDASDRFHTLVLQTYEDLRLTLARILLYSCRGEHEVANRLREIGFAIRAPKPVRIPANLLALDLLGVVAIFVSAALLPTGARLEVALWIGVTVAVNHCVAALFAVVPKQVWGFADIRRAGERPVLAYLVSAVLTLTTVLPIGYALYLLRGAVLGEPPRLAFSLQCAWLALPVLMALSLAFACDDAACRDREPAWLAWAAAAAIGGVIAGAGFLVVQWLEQHGAHSRGPVMIPITIGAAMGALFGGTIPRWYRRTMRQVRAAPASTALGAEVPVAGG
ncbi:MAG: hypothetical protein JO023_25050 [Chloroflexi bacterium]|nr:hypothetical protein [Chloroflexota bacterium]